MSSQNQPVQIPRPTGRLSGACYDALLYVRSLPPADRGNALGFLSFDFLDALEGAVPHVPAIQSDQEKILALLSQAGLAQLTAEQAKELKEAYDRALEAAFPTTQSYLFWSHQFHGLSVDHNLESISFPRLLQLEVASFANAGLRDLLKELHSAFGRIKNLSDSQGFRQVFEYYGEAVVYSLLSAKFKTKRIVAGSNSMPDFSCSLPSGKEFFVELKSFDIVDGPYRSDQMHEDAIQQQIELEKQTSQGERVAMAVREVSPYKRAYGRPDEYDPRSLLTVVDALAGKARSAFKSKQFAQGPTFAFVLGDRLLLPAGKNSVAPHYFERGAGGAVISGVLWHVCFGQTGWPIFRMPDFEGQPGLEGYMSASGLFSDPNIPFPSGALIFADTGWSEDTVLGLYDSNWPLCDPSWTVMDTEQVIHTLCSAFNDEKNSYGQLVAST